MTGHAKKDEDNLNRVPDFVDLDEGNHVVRHFRIENDRLIRLDPPKAVRFYGRALLDVFLPAGYPHTVTSDYLSYQLYDSFQAFSSSIAGLLASRAILTSLGVGDADSDATGALIVTIVQEMFSRLSCIVFVHRFGQAIEPECKKYRFLADIFNDTALCLDLLTPIFTFWPRLLLMSFASVLRALCGVSAGASKATLSAHFARNGNVAELNAKEASQETVISLLGMLAGSALVQHVHGNVAVWTWMTALVVIHLAMNYRAVRSVEMDTLNCQRATLLYRAFCEAGKQRSSVPSPKEIAKKENIIFDRSASGLEPHSLARPVFASGTTEFISRVGPTAMDMLIHSAWNTQMTFLSSIPMNKDTPVILLREGVDSSGIAEAFFGSLYTGHDKKNEQYMLTNAELEEFKQGLLGAGWKFDPVALLTGRVCKHGSRVTEAERITGRRARVG